MSVPARRYLGKVVVTLLGVGLLIQASPAASAQAMTKAPAHAKGPEGSYEWVTVGGANGRLTLNSDNTFTTDFRESGIWVSFKTSVALEVTDSNGATYTDCIYLGMLTKTGINSTRKLGPVTCSGRSLSWYATTVSSSTAPARADPTSHRAAAPSSTARKLLGSYTIYPQDGEVTFSTDATPVYDQGLFATGYWITLGTMMAFSYTKNLTGNMTGNVWIGSVSKKGIGSAAKPGRQESAGQPVSTWYAVPVAG